MILCYNYSVSYSIIFNQKSMTWHDIFNHKSNIDIHSINFNHDRILNNYLSVPCEPTVLKSNMAANWTNIFLKDNLYVELK